MFSISVTSVFSSRFSSRLRLFASFLFFSLFSTISLYPPLSTSFPAALPRSLSMFFSFTRYLLPHSPLGPHPRSPIYFHFDDKLANLTACRENNKCPGNERRQYFFHFHHFGSFRPNPLYSWDPFLWFRFVYSVFPQSMHSLDASMCAKTEGTNWHIKQIQFESSSSTVSECAWGKPINGRRRSWWFGMLLPTTIILQNH